MPRDGLIPNIRDYDPDKEVKKDVEIPRMPSPFTKYLNREEEGVQIVEADIPSVSGEQRRMLLQEMVPKVLKHIGVDVLVAERIRYVPIPETREQMSRVAFALLVARPRRIEKFRFNVPPHGDWNREVMIVILEYIWAWGHKQKLA